MADDDFRVARSRKGNHGNQRQRKRVYIGNLPRTFPDERELQNALEAWLEGEIAASAIGRRRIWETPRLPP